MAHSLRAIALLFVCFLFSIAGYTQKGKSRVAAWKEEIRKMEKQFETDLLTKGVSYAFAAHAAPDAVIKRENDTLVKGREAIRSYYSQPFYQSAKAYWTPDFIDVSADGTMAYTYGRYRWEFTDEKGKKQEITGVFHTVWKRQPNGEWKYVWD